MSDPNDAFVRYKSQFAVTWSLLNVQRLHTAPCATAMGKPLTGRTVYVVGSSHCLTRNGDWLPEAQARGGVVIGVNSSDPCLRHYGVRPDVIVVRESIDNSAEIEASQAPLVCLDLCAHPDMWTAAGDRLAWFIPGYPRHFHLTQRLGVRPTFGGSSAYTTAVHLALTWGAERIVLVGAGLALEHDGTTWRAYHPSAPRGDCTFSVHGDRLHMHGNESNDALCVASGQRPQPKVIGFEKVPAQDWRDELPIIDTLLDERRWLEIEASRHGKHVELVNASEGGCGVTGWRSRTLADVVRDAPEHDRAVVFEARRVVSQEQNEALVRMLREECDLLERSSAMLLNASGPPLEAIPEVRGLYYGAPLIETLAAYRILDAPKGDGAARCRYVYRAMADAAEEARRVLRAREEAA